MKKTFFAKKWIIAIVILVLIAMAINHFFFKQEPPPKYAVEPVSRGDIEDTVLANGLLQASTLVNVGAQVSGQIKSLAVELGQEVKAGDLIAQIDSLTQQNTLKEAQASLKNIDAQLRAKQAQIKQARLEFTRQKNMLADDASSQADYESAEATLTIYQAELEELRSQREQAEISVDSAKVDLGYTTILAPIDGTVVYTAVEAGQTVNSNQSTPTIVELAKLDTMTIKAEISEADVIKVKPGQQVYFSILGRPNHRYRATLRAIEPGPTSMDGDDTNMTSNDEDAIYYNGLFDVANPQHTLRIGMTAQVSIILNRAENTLLVPAQILRRVDGGADKYQVPVLDSNNQLQYRDVTVGINNKVNAQILSGLKENEQVVIGMSMAAGASDTEKHRPRMRL